ncbi:hypothetical protein [Micromonospora kangleipakensis]|nr:hypothetical protein [Micromonospora kangleipakensis]
MTPEEIRENVRQEERDNPPPPMPEEVIVKIRNLMRGPHPVRKEAP